MSQSTVWSSTRGRRLSSQVPTSKRTAIAALAVILGAATISWGAAPAFASSTQSSDGAATQTVIVRTHPGAGAAARAAVVGAGGQVVRTLAVIHGFSATLPSDQIAAVRRSRGVLSVTEDSSVRLSSGHGSDDDDDDEDWESDVDMGAFYRVTKSIGADDVWDEKVTGRGVGVALIDSGVVPVEGLTGANKVVNGPDLSFESQDPEVRHLDTFGHGTHMAGIIAGRDSKVKSGKEDDPKNFVGVAPDATLINLKVASTDGATDVSQVIAAIDWVVAHRNDPGMNIRVLNLSFGTDSTQSYLLDPLAYAVEVAWHRGIVVVVAAGNDGIETPTLNNPALDPFVVAVGASDHRGTEDRRDDVVADFSNRGNTTRHPDLVAPGRSIVSLRSPNSFIDSNHPEGRVAGDTAMRFFRGSGTSQATAVVSGAAALLLQKRPNLTPDQVKNLLTRSATRMYSDALAQGAGLLDVEEAFERKTPNNVTQTHERATGLGTLEGARGTDHVADPVTGAELIGEQDIFGNVWDGSRWRDAAWAGTVWEGSRWRGEVWSGEAWTGTSWASTTWDTAEWTATTWTGSRWRDVAWTGSRWRDSSWTGTLTGSRWRGSRWRNSSWNSIEADEMVVADPIAPS